MDKFITSQGFLLKEKRDPNCFSCGHPFEPGESSLEGPDFSAMQIVSYCLSCAEKLKQPK